MNIQLFCFLRQAGRKYVKKCKLQNVSHLVYMSAGWLRLAGFWGLQKNPSELWERQNLQFLRHFFYNCMKRGICWLYCILWHRWDGERVEEIPRKHKHYRVRCSLLARGREQQFFLKAQQKQADLHDKGNKGMMTCIESPTLALQKAHNCDNTTVSHKIAYAGDTHFWSKPCTFGDGQSRGPPTSSTLPVCARGPSWLTL